MALGDSYATVAELKTRMGITVSTGDSQLAEALSASSRGVEKCCGRQFNKTTTAAARVYYPDVCGQTVVDDFHTITDLAIKTDQGDDGTFETTWTTSDYQLEPLNGVVDGESGWPFYRITAIGGRLFPSAGKRAPLQVTAQWGWTAVPARVKEATLMGAEELYRLKDAPFGVAGFADFGAIRVRANPYIIALLSPYRRHALLVG